ncbi:nuclear transport factor 2 family protein [Ilumatobacter nonamiensis]|uniref:nuclear transport factor 2 family protein n=1 Tax=Ilumatobacter nonamiensis TaxID=467093 RepID=UPI00034BDCC9|nr:nuclear transport factor 2 family protein [Ilumatobacter nonamiensis]
MTTTDTSTDPLDVAERFFSAITSGDVEAIRGLYRSDAIVWHSYDGIEQTREENMRTLSWSIKNLGEMRYTQVRRTSTDDGFAQQHILCTTNRAGDPLRVPASLFVAVEDGLIVRLDEYIDSADVSRISER